ncbi:hypothetical protein BJV78DRAFT_1135360 [Lactifluus subvellereus]|nr:hypothetical protein BJV78DRAFT_1135360 [Lactifluus subvellereus]
MGDLPYAYPVLHANSPSDSLSVGYSPDELAQAEKDLPTTEFTRRVDTMHHFHLAQEAELVAERSPLLSRKGQERRVTASRFEQVMHTLRRIVARVEEALCVETALARSPRGVLEEPHTTDDLASLMQGLLGPRWLIHPLPLPYRRAP